MERQSNTIYVASISYGKDSLAMLEAIRKLGYPLDRIISAQVWATDTIPADLPEMYAWKAEADKKIYERYGIMPERICAIDKNSGGGASCPISRIYTDGSPTEKNTASRILVGNGATEDLKSNQCKLTYEKLFYREIKNIRTKKSSGGGREQLTASPQEQEIGATECSKRHHSTRQSDLWLSLRDSEKQRVVSRTQIIGYPRFGARGNKCSSELKASVFGKARKRDGRENKYRAVYRNCGGRADTDCEA